MKKRTRKTGRRARKQARGDRQESSYRWAHRLAAQVESVMGENPDADRDNVRHTLILLEQPPLERLRRNLIRARAAAIFRK